MTIGARSGSSLAAVSYGATAAERGDRIPLAAIRGASRPDREGRIQRDYHRNGEKMKNKFKEAADFLSFYVIDVEEYAKTCSGEELDSIREYIKEVNELADWLDNMDASSFAAELGRKGGLKGGAARAASLTPERRKEIAKAAAAKRWGKK